MFIILNAPESGNGFSGHLLEYCGVYDYVPRCLYCRPSEFFCKAYKAHFQTACAVKAAQTGNE